MKGRIIRSSDWPARIFDDCPHCERGMILVGGQDTPFPCPYCNPWCLRCLADMPSPFTFSRPGIGDLLAGVTRTAAGDELFRGYCCDFHKLFAGRSFIAPWMLDQEQYPDGCAYIVTQHIMRPCAWVVFLGYGEATNWKALEADAFRAVEAQRGGRSDGVLGYADCPPELAARAEMPRIRWEV